MSDKVQLSCMGLLPALPDPSGGHMGDMGTPEVDTAITCSVDNVRLP